MFKEEGIYEVGLDGGQSVCTHAHMHLHICLTNMHTWSSFICLLETIDWAAILVQRATSPYWVDPSYLLWGIMRVIFQGLEKRSTWNNPCFNTIIYIYPFGVQRKTIHHVLGERRKWGMVIRVSINIFQAFLVLLYILFESYNYIAFIF